MKAALSARPFVVAAGLDLFFYGEGNSLTSVEDFANHVEDQPEQCCECHSNHQVKVLMDYVAEGADEGWAEPDGEQ